MKVSDKTIGYISFSALILIFAFVAFGMWKAHHATVYTITVDFAELGSLQPEDPATVRGYRVGAVRDVRWIGDRARVTVQFDNPLLLREGTTVRNANYALMGQRRLEIVPSKTGEILKSDYIFQGTFEAGTAEALRLMEEVILQIETVREIVLLIANGDSTQDSFSEIFEKTLQKTEKLLQETDKLAKQLPQFVGNVTHTVDSSVVTLSDLSQKTETTLKTVDSIVQQETVKIGEVLKTASAKTAQTDSLITSFVNSPAGEILKNDSLIVKTEKLLAQMHNLMQVFDTENLDIRDENGNKISLVTWKNIRLIGETAREKAKQRAATEQNSKKSE